MGAIRTLTAEQRAARAERKNARTERHLQAKQRQGVQTCTGRSRQTGLPCRMKAMPGRKQCKFHGGAATGPKTPEGKAKALAALHRANERRAAAKHER